jgi:hypothetical protein
VSLGGVEISVPSAWQMSKRGTTVHFGIPTGEAYMEADVGTVQVVNAVRPQACVDKIVRGIGGNDWRSRVVANAPAALKVDVDIDGKGKQFISYTYVGCNGQITWALSFHWIGDKDQRFAPLAEKIAATLKYRRAGSR